MGEGKSKNGRGGGLKMTCGVLFVLLVVFGAFAIYLFTQNIGLKDKNSILQNQVLSLETEKNNLNSVIKDLESQRADLWDKNQSSKK